MKKNYTEKVALPAKVTVRVENGVVHVKGPKGELSRALTPSVSAKVDGTTLTFTTANGTKKHKTAFYTCVAHMKNLILGVQSLYVYKLKVFSSHFPITAAVQGTSFTVKNFLGEKVPRVCPIVQGVKVTVAGAEITVESIDVEKAGMVASALENLTRISDKDRRVFQDGIYITEKVENKVSQ